MIKLTQCLLATFFTALICGCVSENTEYNEYKTKTDLNFPIPGESLILVGGRTKAQNPLHFPWRDQRFALDIVAMVPGAQPPSLENFVYRIGRGEVAFYRGNDFKNNEDHYCFGRLIVAPGAGLVFDTKDGVFDNVPLTPNENEIPGNYIVIDHMNGEYSMLAHFKQGSILVNNGDKVKAGDPLGLCGNSGNSYVPHLHYHLQNTPRWLDGEGLPAQFQNYTANGLNVYRGEPVQGEIIDSRCSSSSC